MIEKNFQVTDEAFCVDDKGSNRYVDILAGDRTNKLAYIIDPTIRYESNLDVDQEVMAEKKKIYEPCITDIKNRYALEGFEFEVLGLWFGSRGTIGRSVLDLFNRLQLDKQQLPHMAEIIVSASVRMIHQHVYAQ